MLFYNVPTKYDLPAPHRTTIYDGVFNPTDCACNHKCCLFLTQQPPQGGRDSSYINFLDHTQRRTTVGRTPLYE